MDLRTIFRFLLGRRDAIERIAACPRAVVVGLLFVLSAGLAREYDGEDLLAEPYHAFLPLVASLGTSFVLYGLLSVVARCWRRPGQWWLGYTRFLGLYWMTAPLAWLYAIPVERFLPPLEATVVNLYLLAGVSLWRVLLMIRVASVVFSARWWSAVMVVMLFADAVAVLAISVVPQPIMTIMGGVRLTPSQTVIANTSCTVQIWGTLLLPVWFIGTLVALFRRRLTWPDWRGVGALGDGGTEPRAEPSSWRAAWALLAIGVALLPLSQGEQQRRREAERLLLSGDVEGAVRFMSEFDGDAFPPHWDPPPRLGYGENEPPLVDLLEAMLAEQAPAWLWDVYQIKLGFAFEARWYEPLIEPSDVAAFERWMTVLETMPNQVRFAKEHETSLLRSMRLEFGEASHAERFRAWLVENGIDVAELDSGEKDPSPVP